MKPRCAFYLTFELNCLVYKTLNVLITLMFINYSLARSFNILYQLTTDVNAPQKLMKNNKNSRISDSIWKPKISHKFHKRNATEKVVYGWPQYRLLCHKPMYLQLIQRCFKHPSPLLYRPSYIVFVLNWQ